MGERVIENYTFEAAGRLWVVPQYRLSVLPDGTEAVSLKEIARVHRWIAEQLLAENNKELTEAEREFLSDVFSHYERVDATDWTYYHGCPEGLTALDKRFRGTVQLIHIDGSTMLLHSAFYVQKDDKIAVFTEHFGYHLFHRDDIEHIYYMDRRRVPRAPPREKT